MKSILIDTNIYTHALRGEQETISVLQQVQEIGICSISIGELLSGSRQEQGKKRTGRNWQSFWMHLA